MILRGIKFHPCWDASGVRGLDGKGYWFHKPFRHFGCDFSGSTFVAKTVTADRQEGNMPLNGLVPRDLFPRCIWASRRREMALNCVRLSNPGIMAMLNENVWQQWPEPFFVSLMSVRKSAEERRLETAASAAFIESKLKRKPTKPFGVQFNLSCPSMGLDIKLLVKEAREHLTILKHLNVPIVPKITLLTPPELVAELAAEGLLDAVCVSNTIRFGTADCGIDWNLLFRRYGGRSPLSLRGFEEPGGLSGAPLFSLLCDWLRRAQKIRLTVPINAGGGLLETRQVRILKNLGASSVFIGSVAMFHPTRVKSIIHEAHRVFADT